MEEESRGERLPSRECAELALSPFKSFGSRECGCWGMDEYSLDGYDLLDKIGEGTYGDVYKARKKSNGKICAIKFVRASLCA